MEHSPRPTDQPAAPPRRRRGPKAVLFLLVLIGVGSAAAFQFRKTDDDSRPVVEYEKLDEDQATAREQEAQQQVERDKQALKEAQAHFQSAQADWESANSAQEANPSPAAEALLAEAEANLDEAKSRLKAAEDKFKTADQLRAEAEAERERVAKLLALEEANRKALLGKWTRPDENGRFRIELRDDGTGLMIIDFNATNRFLLGTSQLEVDITWEIAGGDHVIFNSLQGRPEKAFDIVSALKGTRRDEVLTHIDENTFTTHGAKNKSKIETWQRLP
jgi:hypothetical protein